MYRAGDERAHDDRLTELAGIAVDLELTAEAESTAKDLFLSTVDGAAPRSEPAVLAASVYAGALIAGDQRSQTAVADAAGVSRLVIQERWKQLLARAGFDPPTW
ncbi:transcription initiation factor IIB family protein [Halobacterium salinarum]|uniref:transcription initiation factor IIB family protein n=1 Tax=Halobacterium salinarum TaxID=2242 RepID=UPI001F268CC5|nr:transcription initiation factor IIB family protein [Halobacterium salinarum]MCF2238711.1 transcription initiation factor IIB family protein [Halobacterium salinarum]